MTGQSHLRQSSPLTAIPKGANRPHRTADGINIAGRGFLVLIASGVAIYAWALFPSTVETGIYVPPPETPTPPAADVNSARKGLTGNPPARADVSLMEAKPDTSTPTMYGSATVWYPSPAANVSVVSVRSKLQALLMLLYSQSGDVDDPAALEAKLQALLTLPDSVLAQLMEHPDLADLNKMLDAVFLGTSDLSGVKTELDKIDVTSVPTPTENLDVVTVNGKPTYIVHTPVVQMATENVAGSPVSALPPPPAGPVTVVSLVQAPASLSATAFAMPPISAQLPPPPPPAPAAQIAALTLAPTSAQLSPPPAPASVSASASVQESAQNSQTGWSGTSPTGSTGTSSGAAWQGGSGDGSTKSDDGSTGSGNPPPDSGQGSGSGQESQGSNQGSQGSNHGSQGSGRSGGDD